MTQHVLLRDFETRGVIDLKKVGAWRYATHPDSDVICCAYSVDDEPVKLWLPGDPAPPECCEAATNDDWLAVAFNDSFERAIEQHIMAPVWLADHPDRPAPMSAGKRIGACLAGPCAPRKPARGEPPGLYWIEDPARRARLYAYCKQDVETERALFARIGFITPEEQDVWLLDALINDRGIHVDAVLANAAIRLADITSTSIDAELAAITGGAVASAN